jgi:hypothetical protein
MRGAQALHKGSDHCSRVRCSLVPNAARRLKFPRLVMVRRRPPTSSDLSPPKVMVMVMVLHSPANYPPDFCSAPGSFERGNKNKYPLCWLEQAI